MPVKGISQVKRAYRAKVQEIANKRAEMAVRYILAEGGARADTMTPIDTSTLINSRYAPQITHTGRGVSGHVGYTAHYAAAVHNAPGKLKGQPRAHFGRTRSGTAFGGGTQVGNYWDPTGEPKFLEKGFKSILPEVPKILAQIFKGESNK